MTKKHQPVKKQCIAFRPCANQSPSLSGTSSDEPSSSMVFDEIEYAQKSTLHQLLTALGSGKKFHTTANKRRKIEGGESDSKQQEGSRFSHASFNNELAEDGDSRNSSIIAHAEEIEPSKQAYADIMQWKNFIEVEDVDDFSDCDVERYSENGEKMAVGDLQRKCQFHAHLIRILSKMEVDVLTKMDWKYKWKIPAFDSSMSLWKGTGDYHLEDDKNNHYGLKMKLHKQWLDCYTKLGGTDFDSSRERHFFSLCNSYQDIMYCAKKGFYMKGLDEDSRIMDAYIMHSLNHVYKTRSLVTKNDSKLARNQDHNETEFLHGEGFLDRGFTRPKVLFLLPFRCIAFRVVKRLIQLAPLSNKTNVEHLDRFLREFGNQIDDESDDMDELGNNAQHDEKLKPNGRPKPLDFEVLFRGNICEEFMIGVKFTRGSIKLYNDFYSSDMIVASPVQVVHAIGKAESEKSKDVDYLSSIEVLIIDHADIIAMQNWSHVNSILENLNKMPSEQHGSDVMRVRPWYLDGYARFYRQTILLGSFLNADMNASFNKLCLNYEGKVKFVSDCKGVLAKVLLPVRQVFERFDASIAEADDARFNYFVKKVFPKIKDSIQGGIMLFIRSYFDFVRIRNFLKSQNASFCLLGEYTKKSDISRARGWFFKGDRKIMLYTERAHFYHRYKIRGIRNLIFYSLPERKEFYPEIINMLDGAKNMSCSVLFSHFDNLQLERIVGSTSSKRMVTSEKSMFVFC